MVITYPLMTVVDDSGNVVIGATVTVSSVTDKAGSAVASPGATVNLAGANVSVDYDAEAKGEAWVTLAVSKVGSTFSGLNAAPAFYLARDSSRTLTALPNAAIAAQTGDAYARLGAPSGVSVSADIAVVGTGTTANGTALSTANNTLAAHTTALATANASLAAGAGFFLAATVSGVTGAGSFTVAFQSAATASDLVGLTCSLVGGNHKGSKATVTGATQVDSTHVGLQFSPPFANAPAVNDPVQVG